MRALVLSGGGSRGAFEAGCISALTAKGVRWDMVAGVSVGALNAALLAQYRKDRQEDAAEELLEFWRSVEGNRSVYKRWFPFGELHSLWKGSLYSTEPLEKLVKDRVQPELFQTSEVGLIVGAVCLENGMYQFVKGDDPNIEEWILASAAFPGMFPPREIDGLHWVDGGVRDATPISDVLNEGVTELDVILTQPLGATPGLLDPKKCKNVLHVGLRCVGLLADEVFNDDLEVSEYWARANGINVNIYQPPLDVRLPDGMTFDPSDITRLLEVGRKVGER